ncbi:acyltransferase domain-containing protein [Paenibacillus sp. BJ-4]|uniref:acyltransferase domain-containing protein n=1 Tax=Paenibacillus sp. BJ-4 TaxID=2878097 RepID=UPI001CF09EFA|nr:acyltransferase domain-containing protein [Paenibacillus sp. BJ-4]
MDKSVVFMFSGQGSQYYGMGKELYMLNSVFRKWMTRLDEIHTDITGRSVLKVLYDDTRQRGEVFDSLLYTHPAIFMVEYALTQVLMDRGIHPDYVLGSSLGEFASVAAADGMSYEDILHCLVKQAQMVEASCRKGGMLAVIGDFRLYDEVSILNTNSELASINYDSHFVISGSCEGLTEIEHYLKANEIICQRLPVQFAFHSSLIDPIALEYTAFLKLKTVRSPTINMVSSMYGGKVVSLDNRFLWDVARTPINFRGALNCLGDGDGVIYIDLGPSGTLANFVKYNFGNKKKASAFSILSPFQNDVKNLDRLCELFD